DALGKEMNRHVRVALASALVGVSECLPASKREGYLDPAAKILLRALDQAKDTDARGALASALVGVSKCLPASKREGYLHPAAKILLGALAKEKDPSPPGQGLAEALEWVSDGLPAEPAAKILLG